MGKLDRELKFNAPMKLHIIADGEERLRRNDEFQARLSELREAICARHASEFKRAGFFHRLILRWHIAAEFQRERGKIEPSRHSLYTCV